MTMTACKSIQTCREYNSWCLVSPKQRMNVVATLLALRVNVCHSEVIVNLTREDVTDTIASSKRANIELFIVSQDGLHRLSSFDKKGSITEGVGSLQIYKTILSLRGDTRSCRNKEQGH